MPISGGQFEAEDIGPGPVVLELLRDNPSTAYTSDEVAQMLTAKGLSTTKAEVENALSDLVAAGRLRKKTIRKQSYYTIERRLGFRRSGG